MNILASSVAHPQGGQIPVLVVAQQRRRCYRNLTLLG